MLIIPSGALMGLWYNENLRELLNYYVTFMGGTVLCLCQQYGHHYGILPVPADSEPVNAFGWNEAQSCYNHSLQRMSCDPYLVNADDQGNYNIDGYFTGYPQNTDVLLADERNGIHYPVMIEYECGLGRVVVTSMFGDWAWRNYQATTQESKLLRDVIAWNVADDNLLSPIFLRSD